MRVFGMIYSYIKPSLLSSCFWHLQDSWISEKNKIIFYFDHASKKISLTVTIILLIVTRNYLTIATNADKNNS